MSCAVQLVCSSAAVNSTAGNPKGLRQTVQRRFMVIFTAIITSPDPRA